MKRVEIGEDLLSVSRDCAIVGLSHFEMAGDAVCYPPIIFHFW